MSQRTLTFIAILLAGLLAYLLATFERAEMPRPVRSEVKTEQPREFVVVNARLFDGQSLVPGSMHVRDGLIVAIGAVDAATGLRQIDAGGRAVLPGLIDSHVHTWGSAREDALRFGVTTLLDMFTSTEMLKGIREQRASTAATNRADFYSAGTLATVSRGHGTQFGMPIPTVDSADLAADWVRARKQEGSDYIKIVIEDLSAYRGNPEWPTLSEASVRALVDAAKAEQLMSVVHVSKRASAEMVLDAGADGLVHIFQDEVAPDAFFQAAASRPFFVTPTLTVIAGMAGESPSVAEDAELGRRLTPEQLQSLKARFNNSGAKYPQLLERALANVARLHASGVPILAGSDAPNPGTAHGISLHEEMAQLVRAGLTPSEAIAAATSTPARVYGLSDRGRLAAGLRADFVIVDGDPTTDIKATRRLHAVYKNGAVVEAR
jgi:imidazolonepropionase-like amidohydrolase